jgi:hypothetical protein
MLELQLQDMPGPASADPRSAIARYIEMLTQHPQLLLLLLAPA